MCAKYIKCENARLYHCNHLQGTRRTTHARADYLKKCATYIPDNKTCCKTQLTFSRRHCPFTQIHTLLREANREYLLISLSLEGLRASDLPTSSTAKTYNLPLHIQTHIHMKHCHCVYKKIPKHMRPD